MSEGKRFNKGKNRIELLSPVALWELAKVFTKGAEKYDDHNWALGMTYSSVFGCLERHTLKRKAGLLRDPETGCLHSSLIMSNAMILTHFDALPERYSEFDDLPNYQDGISNESGAEGDSDPPDPTVTNHELAAILSDLVRGGFIEEGDRRIVMERTFRGRE